MITALRPVAPAPVTAIVHRGATLVTAAVPEAVYATTIGRRGPGGLPGPPGPPGPSGQLDENLIIDGGNF